MEADEHDHTTQHGEHVALPDTPDQHTDASPGPRRPKKPPVANKLLELPPVVGSYLQYANKKLPYRPFPPDVDEIRNKIFKMDAPLLLDSQQIADYWPHVSNIYMRSSRPTVMENGVVSEAWECRIRRRVTLKGRDRHGAGLRNRPSKDDLLGDASECKVRLNLLSFTNHANSDKACETPGFGNCHCIADWLYLERTKAATASNYTHAHSLDLLDEFKRTYGLMYFCKLKVEEGQYSYAAVLRWVKEKYGPVTSQVQHLTKADVANVARPWRDANKNVELRSEIVEENDEHRQRRECLDSIHTTSAERLARAIEEVCKVYPLALEIIAPFMEKGSAIQNQSRPILEGENLVLPPPGRPFRKKAACEPPTPTPADNHIQVLRPVGQYANGYPQPSQAPGHLIISGAAATTPIQSQVRHPPSNLPPSPYVNGGLHPLMNGAHNEINRPSWAQPVVPQKRSAAESPSSAMPRPPPPPPTPPVQDHVPDIEEQLRNELG